MLEEALERIADQMEKRDSLKRQIRAAMAYPMMIGGFAATVLLALVAFLVPVFEEVFKDFNGKLPMITRISVGMSHFVTGQWYLLIGITVGTVFAFKKWKRSSWGRYQWDCHQAEVPGQDRGRDPQDRARALVAHLLRASCTPACRCCRRSTSPRRPPATPTSSARWTT